MKRKRMYDGIVITLSANMMKERGYKNWLSNFLHWMNDQDEDTEHPVTYWFRQGNKPKHEAIWLYICIGGRIRWRCNIVQFHGAMEKTFQDEGDPNKGNTLFGRAWVECTGPAIKAPRNIPMNGFQGFRYTQKLF